MRRGFSLLEMVLALLLLQVGVLATVGLIHLSQRNLRRAELTMRGVLEAVWVGDSLSAEGSGASGRRVRPWGELQWSQSSAPTGGHAISVWSPVDGDTLATILALPAFPPPPDGSRAPGSGGDLDE